MAQPMFFPAHLTEVIVIHHDHYNRSVNTHNHPGGGRGGIQNYKFPKRETRHQGRTYHALPDSDDEERPYESINLGSPLRAQRASHGTAVPPQQPFKAYSDIPEPLEGWPHYRRAMRVFCGTIWNFLRRREKGNWNKK